MLNILACDVSQIERHPRSLFSRSDDNKSAAVPSYLFMRIPRRYRQTAKRTLKYSRRVASSRPSIFYSLGDDIESSQAIRDRSNGRYTGNGFLQSYETLKIKEE